MSWVALLDGPGGVSEAESAPDWIAAANWLRGMLDAAHPPHDREHPSATYERAVEELRSAPRDQAIIIRAGRYLLALQPGKP